MTLLDLFSRFLGEKNNYVIPKPFVEWLDGDYVAAVVLKECIYWSSHFEDIRDGWFYRDEQDWEKENHLSRRQVNRAITTINTKAGGELIRKKVEKIRTRDGYMLQQTATHYRIDEDLLSRIFHFDNTGNDTNRRSGDDTSGKSLTYTTDTFNGDVQQVNSPSVPAKPEVDVDWWFDQFWEPYPRKDGKEAARKAWKKLPKNPDLYEHIINQVDLFKQTTWKGVEKRFIPMGSTFLNGKRWEDEPMAPASPSRGRHEGMSGDEILAYGQELEERLKEMFR